MLGYRFSMALIGSMLATTLLRARATCAFAGVTTCSTVAFGVKASRNTAASAIQSRQRQRVEYSRLFATAKSLDKKSGKKEKQEVCPITLLSGFLGSGKTTALKHLLENTEGFRVGVIVNDVASVNIDAKLVSSTNQGAIELQNGCACCSLADELLTSVQQLLNRKDSLDAVVVELSGVADPVAVKSNWKEAKAMGHPATKVADVKRIVTLVDACTFGTDWMTWDQAGERRGWVDEGDDCSAQRHVPELLAEQVEAANLILVNKADLAGSEQVKVASSVARAINDKADLFEVEFGKVSPNDVLGSKIDIEVHNHDSECEDPDCTHESHSHSHHHHDSAAAEPNDGACNDPDCTDPSHDHSHSHEHSSTAADQLGIDSFVYKATKPFNPPRIMALLNKWPVPIKEDLDLDLLKAAKEEEFDDKIMEESPFVGVLRSKGFCWFAPINWSGNNNDVWRHDTAMYWSHAGKHFGISTAGKWWGTISKEKMKEYFVSAPSEYERIINEDFVSEEWGDRRQELVFIGANIDQDAIIAALDDCLLTDEEMDLYRLMLRNYNDSTFSAEANGPSLFDVGGTDHVG